MVVADWLKMWYTTYVEQSRELAPSTKAQYRRSIAAVPEWLGAADLADPLLPLSLHRWVQQVSAVHPRAAQLDRIMLSRALRIASKLGLCSTMVMDSDLVPKPSHRPKRTLVLTSAETREYRLAAQAVRSYPLLMLCLCGLRRGEALGARWQDLHGDMLHVCRQRQKVEGKLVSRRLKSERSDRTLQLPPWLLADLAATPRTITGWILDTTPDHLYKDHRRVLQAAQLPPVTLHGLRHTFATEAARQGLPMKHLQTALGHAKVKLTADLYADHLDPLSTLPALVWACL